MMDLPFRQFFYSLILIICFISKPCSARRVNPNEKVCIPKPPIGVSSEGTLDSRYADYKRRFSNCTIVEDNLEIVHLDVRKEQANQTYDLSFLSGIEEVYGYVFIAFNYVDEIPLTNLRVIHGNNLYFSKSGEGLSLSILYNHRPNSTSEGLQSLKLNSLRDILNGNVSIVGNNLLCYADTINWKDIFDKRDFSVRIEQSADNYQSPCEEKCDISCTQNITGLAHCWGPGTENCQKLHRLTCSNSCHGSCFGPGESDCCSPECAGGCNGSSSACWTCRNFLENGKCEKACQPAFIYNKITSRLDPNPHVKYAFKNLCVDKCEDHMYVKDGACVKDCGPGYKPPMGEGNQCIHCGDACPKTCNGSEVTNNNILKFSNCTLIQGSLKFLSDIFKGNDPLIMENMKVFESVEEITGCLQVDGSYPNLISLSVFKNLKRILGQDLCGAGGTHALQIALTNLIELGLNSLETIAKGEVMIILNNRLETLDLVSLKSVTDKVQILRNSKLCYANSINWDRISSQKLNYTGNSDQCDAQNKTCSAQCRDGCWGPGDDMCMDCKDFRFDRKCLTSCGDIPGLFQVDNDTRICKKCDSECEGGCTGVEADQCNSCKNLQDGPYCRAQCPEIKYGDENNRCQFCSKFCKNGCTGPNGTLGTGGCRNCQKYVEMDVEKYECAGEDYSCRDGFYDFYIRIDKGKDIREESKYVPACMKCHPECLKCDRPESTCTRNLDESVCRNFRLGDRCVPVCPDNHYVEPGTKTCLPCHKQCNECQGPGNDNCLACRYFKIYVNEMPSSYLQEKYNRNYTEVQNGSGTDGYSNDTSIEAEFYCEDLCPPVLPDKVKRPNKYDSGTEDVCRVDPVTSASQTGMGENAYRNIAVVGAAVGVILIALIIGLLIRGKKQKDKKEQERRKEEILGMQSLKLSSPSRHAPDLSYLRLINEMELTRGATIGSGAFGTVFKGIWTPSGEKIKIPVAIKVLKAGANLEEMNAELLDEARIMAAVRHENCIRILAVSLTAELMLVTQLMPNGSLLDYVRKYRDSIGSNALLTWSEQIAQGMQHLEEMGIVHRDLAARNVLVESPMMVKITDFGLAKLMNDSHQYLSEGGKVPIKWLALESIQHRVFTHKSDVWSYGVTLWEIFTYGQRPYESTPARNLCEVLERGERLPQPQICTIDVYMIMIKCWMVDAQSRPTFSDLVNTFTGFSNDPGRYLVIQQEDKMQLPSAEQNLREMLRDLSILEGDSSQVISAEEYLRPHDLILEHLSKGNSKVDYTNCSDGSASPLVSPTGSKIFTCDSDARGGEHREVSRQQSQRYCPNPSREHSNNVRSSMRAQPVGKQGEYACMQKGRMVADEDDYLKPKSSLTPINYIDVLSTSTADKKNGDKTALVCDVTDLKDEEEDCEETQLDYVNNNPQKISGFENPEYFEKTYLNELMA